MRMQKLNQLPTSFDAFVWYLHLHAEAQNVYRKVEQISSVRVRLMRFCEMFDVSILVTASEYSKGINSFKAWFSWYLVILAS